jgi:hypothetical protein
MSFFSEKNIPFGVKASNMASVANFSSTLEDSYILIIANNCNIPVDNGNNYDTMYNNYDNAALFGVNVNNPRTHEAYIGIKRNDISHKIAKFNSESISFDVNTIINGNLLPSISSNYDLGDFINQWRNVYLSGSIHAKQLYGDGSGIKNIDISSSTTDSLPEGNSNLYFTNQRAEAVFNQQIVNTTADDLQNGQQNQFIVNSTFSDLFIDGTLKASNLNILGTTTTVDTERYQSEQLVITSDTDFLDGPSILVSQVGIHPTEIFRASFNDDSNIFVIKSLGYVGIGVDEPTARLDVAGSIKSTLFIGDGSALYNVNLNDKSTSEIQEGSNQYFTTERVSKIVDASNIILSNYIIELRNTLDNNFNIDFNEKFSDLQSNIYAYVNDSSNIKEIIRLNSSQLSNYFKHEISNLQDQLLTKESILNGAISTVKYVDLNSERVLISDASGKIGASTVKKNELITLSGIKNNIQVQLDNINTALDNISADDIQDGITNRFIVNNIYDDYLYVKGTLYASNLNVFNNPTFINTTTTQASNFQIVNNDAYGPSLSILHNSLWFNIVEIYNNDTPVFFITQNNNVGIGVTSPTEKLEIDGTVKATMFKGDGSELYNVNLSDKTTSEISEGSNQYFTPEKVAILIDSSNIIFSNLLISQVIQYANNQSTTAIATSASYTDTQVSAKYVDAIAFSTLKNLTTSNEISSRLTDLTTEIDRISSNIFDCNIINRILAGFTNFNIDTIQSGVHNKFIIDNVYDNDLTITGKLTVGSLEVIDLGLSYESIDGTTINADLQSYIKYIVSNVVPNVTLSDYSSIISNISNQIVSIIRTLPSVTDSIQEGEHNKFIIDNVYDNDLTITGKLHASALDVSNFIILDGCNYSLTSYLNLIDSKTTDDIVLGHHNKFIIDNVYNNDLLITGKLTTPHIEITNLDIVYDTSDGPVTTGLQDYVRNITSNICKSLYTEVDNIIIEHISNIESNINVKIYNLTTDTITVGDHNKYIVNNVYDGDMTIFGQLTVNSILVQNSEFTYENNEGHIVNSDLKSYVNFIFCNMFETSFRGYAEDLLTADYIPDGTINKYIISNIYDNDMTITGTLNVPSMHTNEIILNNESIYTYISNIFCNLSLDDLNNGYINKFIMNNIYNDDLTVAGKLSVAKLETTNIDIIYEQNDNIITADLNTYIAHIISTLPLPSSLAMTEDLKEYIQYIASNLLINQNIGGQQFANTDDIIEGAHQKFIIDNVYDDDMVITGKLSVSELEVIDIDIEYETEDGTIVSTNIKSYIEFISSNLFKTVQLQNFVSYDQFISNKTSTSNHIENRYNTLNSSITSTFSLLNSRLLAKDESTSNLIKTKISALTTDDIIEGSSNIFYKTENVTKIVNASNLNLKSELQQKIIDSSNAISIRLNNLDIPQSVSTILNSSIKDTSNFALTLASDLQSKFNTDHIIEGSNLFYTDARVRNIVEVSDVQMSNIINNLARRLDDDILESYDSMYSFVVVTDANISNLIKKSTKTITNTINTLTADKIADGNSNRFIVNDRYDRDLTLGNLTIVGNIVPSEHVTYNLGSPEMRWKEIYLAGNTIHLNNTIISSDPDTNGLIITNENNDAIDINNFNQNLSNYVKSVARTFEATITNLNSDDIEEGVHNKYIVNNVYDNNLVVTGKLTVSKLEVTDLQLVYEEDGNSLNTDLKSYIDYTSSNLIYDEFDILNQELDDKLNKIETDIINNSNSLAKQILISDNRQSNFVIHTSANTTLYILYQSNLLANTIAYNKTVIDDKIINLNIDNIATGTSNKYIVNNIYNNDLYIQGTLYASNLVIIGSNTVIQTNTYTTENMEIISDALDGPAFKVVQNGILNIAEFYKEQRPVLILKNSGDIQTYGNINNVTSNEFSYLSGVRSPVQAQFNSLVQTINTTSNNLAQTINTTSNNLTQTINTTSNNLVQTINTTSNSLVQTINTTSNSLVQTINTTSNSLVQTINTTSNSLVQTINTTSNNLAQTINTTSNSLVQTINTTSNSLTIATQNLEERVKNLNADNVPNGSINKYIVNNIYNNDLYIRGTLYASNLVIIGSNTVIHTNTYTTENMEIISDALDGPAFKVVQNGILNIAEFYKENVPVLILKNTGDIQTYGNINNVTSNEFSYLSGITSPVQTQFNSLVQIINTTSNSLFEVITNTSNTLYTATHSLGQRVYNLNADNVPNGTSNKYIMNNTYNNDLYIQGTLSATTFIGDGSLLQNISFANKSTSMLQEGSNMYFTVERVSKLIDGSNSALITKFESTSNSLLQQVKSTLNELITFSNLSINLSSISNLSLDTIKQGSSNKYIVNNTYNNDLYIQGILSATTFIGDGSLLQNISFANKSTSMLQEGSNMYFTVERVSKLIDSSNSSLVTKFESTSNSLLQQFRATVGDLIGLSNIDLSGLLSSNISLDVIKQGTKNKYIIDDKYDADLTINGQLYTDYINVKNNISIINNSTQNGKCLDIVNITNNTCLNILQIGNGDIIKISKNYNPVFTMQNNGFFGNVTNPAYNIDIEGTIKSTYFRGNANLLYNLNLRDKTTSELREGCNLYYTDDRVYTLLAGAKYFNENPFIPLIEDAYSNMADKLFALRNDISHTIANIRLDNIVQGETNQYIVNQIYNDSLLVNGTLTVKDIRILEVDNASYSDIYTSNLYVPPTSESGYISINDTYVKNATLNANISNIANSLCLQYSNLIRQEYDPVILDIRTDISDMNSNLNNELDFVKESMFYINLDNVLQGEKNQYIVNNIFNNSLLINGILTVKDIRILEFDEAYYSEVYTSNLYNPSDILNDKSGYSVTSSLRSATLNSNISNIANSIAQNYSDITNAKFDNMISNIENNISLIDKKFETEVKDIQESLYYINLDNIIQGSNNKYIVNNIYNNSLLVNGTLTVKDIRIIDTDTSYSEIYNSMLYNPSNNQGTGNNNKFAYYGNQNISNIALQVAQNYSNIIRTEYDPIIADIYYNIGLRSTLSELATLTDYVNITQYTLNQVNNTVDELQEDTQIMNGQISTIQNNVYVLRNDLEDFKETQYHVNLDRVIQGSNNKYIVNNIYNNSLLVNGVLTVRDIRILDIGENYADIYNSSLYDAQSGTGTHSYSVTANISNIVIDILKNRNYDDRISTTYSTLAYGINYETTQLANRIHSINQIFTITSNQQANEISLLKNNIDMLSSNLSIVLTKLADLTS